TVTGVEAGALVTLYNQAGDRLVSMKADAEGQAHFAYIPAEYTVLESGLGADIPVLGGTTLKAGDGYVIKDETASPVVESAPFRVLDVADVPDESLYAGQTLHGIIDPLISNVGDQDPNEGFNYITMRDGVKLGVMVRLPDPALYGPGPYPTVIEYSGYAPSRPDRKEPGTNIASSLGFATVAVNMRGTGCSGGVFDVFNPAQHADGYDLVEVVARQDFVLGHRVGMVGLSYSGIAQLFVARTNPPSLAAVTPLSVIADPWQEQWPGGIYNQGFTRSWLEQRDSEAAAGGQSWTHDRIAAGDTTCAAHQRLRSQNIDFEAFLHALEFYNPDARDRSLPRLVHEIRVPVYLTGAFQDEQTGAQFGNMLDHFENAAARKFIVFNGRHPDGYSPMVLTRWFEFLEFYVARRVPRLHPAVRLLGGQEFSSTFGVEGLEFEPDRFADFANDDYAGALAAYEAEPEVRVLFESGARPDTEPGAPAHRFEAAFDRFPPAEAVGHSYYLGPQGTLVPDAVPAETGADQYRHDPDAGTKTFFGPRGYELLAPLWDIDWTDFGPGEQLAYATEPFAEDVVMVGAGYAELYFASEADDANIQVTLSILSAAGDETYITSGWLRAGHRYVDEAASDEFRVEHSFRLEDFEPLVPGVVVPLKIAIPPFGQAFRAGSRLRLTITTPGRNHGTWEFENPTYDGTRPLHTVHRGGPLASRLYLPLVSGIEVPADPPACPSLRGQPCRPYQPQENQPAP
ncbi:MAG: CocE/NonD family hydrolase, partial [Myxococcales bacterium]|nr:CocE/NonD family hydrolase [Myxococcales bacterium]